MIIPARLSSRSSLLPAWFRLMHLSYHRHKPTIVKPDNDAEETHIPPCIDRDTVDSLDKHDGNGRGGTLLRTDDDNDICILPQKLYLHASGNDDDQHSEPTDRTCKPSYQLHSEKKIETLNKEIHAISQEGQLNTVEKCNHEVYNAGSKGTRFQRNMTLDSSEGENYDMQKAQLIKVQLYSPKELYVILDLNGLLIKRWDKNPSLPGMFKIRDKWIQLRPGCAEFLQRAFTFFRVGIWSTMTSRNVQSVCAILEHQARKPLPFFMIWDKESCYQHQGIQRPDKLHVTADFKPLSLVWKRFPHLGFQNTLLVDDSPYKACMNNPHNCIFPDAFSGCTKDTFLTEILWPYLEAMQKASDINSFVANNRLGQQPITASHTLYNHVRPVMERKRMS